MTPDQLRDGQVPDLIRALRPLLRSMLGETQGENVMQELLSECKP
jgi:hypothetical protein